MYKRQDTARAVTDCELKFLTLSDLSTVCESYSTVRAQMWALHMQFESTRINAAADMWSEVEHQQVEQSTVDIAERMGQKLHEKVEQKKDGDGSDDTTLPNAVPVPKKTPPTKGSSGRQLVPTKGSLQYDASLEVNLQRNAKRTPTRDDGAATDEMKAMARLEGRVVSLEGAQERAAAKVDEVLGLLKGQAEALAAITAALPPAPAP